MFTLFGFCSSTRLRKLSDSVFFTVNLPTLSIVTAPLYRLPPRNISLPIVHSEICVWGGGVLYIFSSSGFHREHAVSYPHQGNSLTPSKSSLVNSNPLWIHYKKILLGGHWGVPPRPLDIVFIPIYLPLGIQNGVFHAPTSALARYPPQAQKIVGVHIVFRLENLPDAIGKIINTLSILRLASACR